MKVISIIIGSFPLMRSIATIDVQSFFFHFLINGKKKENVQTYPAIKLIQITISLL